MHLQGSYPYDVSASKRVKTSEILVGAIIVKYAVTPGRYENIVDIFQNYDGI